MMMTHKPKLPGDHPPQCDVDGDDGEAAAAAAATTGNSWMDARAAVPECEAAVVARLLQLCRYKRADESEPNHTASSAAALRVHRAQSLTKAMADKNRKITPEELAQHATAKDCWFVIDGIVYDVTKYQDTHPGGNAVMVEHAGKDCTPNFEDIGAPAPLLRPLFTPAVHEAATRLSAPVLL
jgi:cytochrome b involved in lipid metabolism